jgi:hypothetical protein
MPSERAALPWDACTRVDPIAPFRALAFGGREEPKVIHRRV